MFKRITILMLVALIGTGLAAAPAARAQTTWYVDDDAANDPGPGDPNISDPDEDGSPQHPFDAIQEGIDAASEGDTALVLDGTYTGTGNRNLDFAGKAITVCSANGPGYCFIDCEGEARGFWFHSGETEASVLDGFAITNGNAPAGGGLLCFNSSPTVTNCVIVANTATEIHGGGGVYCERGDPTITNCAISSNSAENRGGAVCCAYDGSPTIANCTISNNSAAYGGAFCCADGSSPTITNCTIRDGHAQYGGGVYCETSSPTLADCAISENSAGNRGGGVYCEANSSPTMTNCTVSNNLAYAGAGIYCYYSNLMISNCMISSNSASYFAGVYCYQSSATISNCTISNNSGNYGAGVCCRGWVSGLTISNCTISRNSASEGGGVWCYYSNPTITNCAISGNSAGFGGGVYCDNYGNPTISNCTITNNLANYGGGVYWRRYRGPTISNCTINGNSANDGGGVCCGGWESSAIITNCILWGDQPQEIACVCAGTVVTYSNIQGGWPGQGNIDADPLFGDPDGPDDDPNTWEDNNYHLSAGSPCIDAANNEAVPADELDLDEDGDTAEPIPFDLDGNPRFVDDPHTDDTGNPDHDYPDLPIVDMGAYEFQVPCPGDIDGDGDTDHGDLGALLRAWGSQPGDPNWNDNADLDGNGEVDHGDLGIFLVDWGCGT